jgi:hypothetical protein
MPDAGCWILDTGCWMRKKVSGYLPAKTMVGLIKKKRINVEHRTSKAQHRIRNFVDLIRLRRTRV